MRKLLIVVVIILLGIFGFWVWQDTGGFAQHSMEKEDYSPASAVRPVPWDNNEVRLESATKSTEPVVTYSVPTTKTKKSKEDVQAEGGTSSALQWALNARNMSLLIGKLRAIALGNYLLKDDEEMPDIHKTFAVVHGEFLTIKAANSGEIFNLMVNIDSLLGTMAQGLSPSPTLSELDVANLRRREVALLIDRLYLLLEERR
jgi:hypothetical protein